MELDCKFIGDDAEEAKKALCLAFRFPILYADASEDDIALFLNNIIAVIVQKTLMTAQMQNTTAQLQKGIDDSIKKLQDSQKKIEIKMVSRKPEPKTDVGG